VIDLKEEKEESSIEKNWFPLLLSFLLGLSAYFLKIYIKSGLLDPLLVAMLFGILINIVLRRRWSLSFSTAPLTLIPIGIVFYGMKNLNFVEFSMVNPYVMALLGVIMLTYFGVIFLLGKLLNQRKKITYLTATGSAICGASAIAITSSVIEADPDDVSVSLLSVFAAAMFGLFLLLPFLTLLFGFDNKLYALFSASVLQFTGFVKVSLQTLPFLKEVISMNEAIDLALSVKAVRYLGLLIAIPLFASLTKKKFILPWYLWAFLGAGILGSYIYATNETLYKNTLIPIVKPIYTVLWASAMAAIGLNTDIEKLLGSNGIRALVMSFLGFFTATVVFILGVSMVKV